jgi:hypothetical protein
MQRYEISRKDTKEKEKKAMLLMLKNYKKCTFLSNKKAANHLVRDFLCFSVFSGASYSWLM